MLKLYSRLATNQLLAGNNSKKSKTQQGVSHSYPRPSTFITSKAIVVSVYLSVSSR